jgi:hypothetical protein
MEQKFPLVTVRAFTRISSDHTPLLIDTWVHAHLENNPRFSSEILWLRQDGFYDLVATEWASVTHGDTPIERWNKKTQHLRRFLRGWTKTQSGKYKKETERLLSIIDELDIKAETYPLSENERKDLRNANEQVNKLWSNEESKWTQRANVKHVQEGGNNTKYFHLIVNGKHRKKKIFQLEKEEGTIVEEENLEVFITEYYKPLFGEPTPNGFTLIEDIIHDIPQVD